MLNKHQDVIDIAAERVITQCYLLSAILMSYFDGAYLEILSER